MLSGTVVALLLTKQTSRFDSSHNCSQEQQIQRVYHEKSLVADRFTVAFQLFVRALYAVAPSAFIQLYQAIFHVFRSLDRYTFTTSIFVLSCVSMIRNMYLRQCILCRFPLFLVWAAWLVSADHTQAAVKESVDSVVEIAEPCGAVKREP